MVHELCSYHDWRWTQEASYALGDVLIIAKRIGQLTAALCVIVSGWTYPWTPLIIRLLLRRDYVGSDKSKRFEAFLIACVFEECAALRVGFNWHCSGLVFNPQSEQCGVSNKDQCARRYIGLFINKWAVQVQNYSSKVFELQLKVSV